MCITRINGELIEDADDLDIVISMYNLLEYSKNYGKTIGSLYNYYRDELTNDNNNNFANRNVVNSNAFKYKNKTTGNTYNADAAAAGYDATKKWYIINDENNTNYGVNKDTPDTIKYDTRVFTKYKYLPN